MGRSVPPAFAGAEAGLIATTASEAGQRNQLAHEHGSSFRGHGRSWSPRGRRTSARWGISRPFPRVIWARLRSGRGLPPPDGLSAQLGAAVDVELSEDVGEVGLHGPGEMNIRSPIWGLVSPWATSSTTLTSVGVSDSQPPGGRRRGPRARRAHSSASSSAQLGSLGARGRVRTIAERLDAARRRSRPSVAPRAGRGPIPISARARSAAANSRTASSWRLEARGDLPEGVETSRDVGRVAALDAGVEVRKDVLLSGGPIPARRCQAAQGQPRPGRKEAIVDPLGGRLRLERGGLGGAVRQQASRFGKQAERPRQGVDVASLEQRHQALEPAAGLLEPAGCQLGEADRGQEMRHGRVRRRASGRGRAGFAGARARPRARPAKHRYRPPLGRPMPR